MNKFLLLIVIVFATTLKAFSQNKPQPDSVAYLMKSDEETTDKQADARFLRLIIKTDSGMYHVQDYYMDSKPKLIAKSTINDAFFVPGAQGICYEFFSNGNRKSTRNYKDGKVIGDVTEHYIDGSIYKIETMVNDVPTLKTCYDRDGKKIAENGSGHWLIFDDDFKLMEEGTVVSGLKDGPWKSYLLTGRFVNSFYNKGILDMSKQAASQVANSKNSPNFKGGPEAMQKYLDRVLIYPSLASSLDIKGIVAVSFFVEEDGSLTDIKITQSAHQSLSNKTLKVLQNMPKWNPGIVDGKPTRMEYRLIIRFFKMDTPLRVNRDMDING